MATNGPSTTVRGGPEGAAASFPKAGRGWRAVWVAAPLGSNLRF